MKTKIYKVFIVLFGTITSIIAEPNVVLIYADDLGMHDVNIYGTSDNSTPFLDAMARQGMVFQNSYGVAPNCSPSRASMITGMDPTRHGINTVGNSSTQNNTVNPKLKLPDNNRFLGLEHTTIAEILKAKGYATACIGKWHIGNPGVDGPEEQGFDINIGGTSSGAPSTYWSPYNISSLENGPTGEYLTDRLGNEAVNWIEQQANTGTPFFCYLPLFCPHTPLEAPAHYIEDEEAKGKTGNDAVFAAMVRSMDENIGKVLAKLDELNIAENTIVIFTSDHGGASRSTGNFGNFRGKKENLTEGGMRVPLVIRWPNGNISAGRTSNTVVSGLDILPTLVETCSAETPDQPIDGSSLIPFLKGNEDSERSNFWIFNVYRGQDNDNGTVPNENDIEDTYAHRPSMIMRKGKWKLWENFEDMSYELYDLENDPGEMNNLASVNPEIVSTMAAAMQKWKDERGFKVPAEINDSYVPPEENIAPVAHNDVINLAGNVITGDLMINDYDLDADFLTVARLTSPLHGSLTLDEDGLFTYTAGNNFPGEDFFLYEVSDGIETNSAIVIIKGNSKLLLHWTLDESSGFTVSDETGENPGEVQGVANWLDGSFNFNGITNISSSFTGITGTDSRTVSCWIKTSTGGDIVSWGSGAGGRFQLTTNRSNGALRVNVGNGNIVGTTDLLDNNWHHIAVVFPEGANNITQAILFIDGKQEAAASSKSKVINTTEGVFSVGYKSKYFTGLIDDIKIYGSELNDTDIKNLFESR